MTARLEVGIVCADFQEVAKQPKERGAKLMSDEPVEIRKSVIALLAEEPEGNYVEFTEYPGFASSRTDLFRWRRFFEQVAMPEARYGR